MMSRKMPTFVQVRTTVLFIVGIAGVAYTTLVDQTDRPTLLILFAAMLGLPLFLRTDEKRPYEVKEPTKEARDDEVS